MTYNEILSLVGLNTDDFSRFRYMWIEKDANDKPNIVVRTRCGNGMSEIYYTTEDWHKVTDGNTFFVSTEQDDFDITYLYHTYRFPDGFVVVFDDDTFVIEKAGGDV